MVNKYEQAIRNAQRLDKALSDLGVKPVSLVATVGELLVLRELEKRGFDPNPIGGQARCDILLNEHCIEVKTSTHKENKGVNFFGWTVQRHGTRKGWYDFLVCVGIENIKKALVEPHFYIFTGEEARRIPERNDRRHKSTKRALDICRSDNDLGRLIDRNGIEGWPREINENLERFRDRWDVLK